MSFDRQHRISRTIPLAALVVLAAACGSSTPEPAPVETAAAAPKHKSNGIGMSAEVGALDPDQTQKAFLGAKSQMDDCWKAATSHLSFVAGKVSIHVRVDHQGHPKTVHLKESTLGDDEMEKCIVHTIEGVQFPAPEGGEDGIADYDGLEFPANEDVRQPVDWSESDMGKTVKDAKAALEACKAQGGGGSLAITMYVGVDGHVKSAGVAGDASAKAGDCVVERVKKLRFNSPGSFAAKASLAAD